MKRIFLVGSLLLVTTMVIMPAVFAALTTPISYNPKGNVWTFSTVDFSAKDIDEITTVGYFVNVGTEADPVYEFTPVTPLHIVLLNNQVRIILGPSDTPESIDSSLVEGTVNGQPFSAVGPAFAWARR